MTVDGNWYENQPIRDFRLGRIQQCLANAQCPAIVLFDPINFRYATGTRNMQVWTMHNVCRYAVVFASGDVMLFELPSATRLSRRLVADIRPALSADFMAVGSRVREMASRWAESMAALLTEKGIGERTLAIDRGGLSLAAAAQSIGLDLTQGQAIMERARGIKSPWPNIRSNWTTYDWQKRGHATFLSEKSSVSPLSLRLAVLPGSSPRR